MHRLMRELRQEHMGFHQLIALLSAKLSKLNQGIQPDFNVMEDALDYIDDYTCVYHHPKEDIIYNYIVDHQLDNQGLFAAIIQEHDKFPMLISHLKQAIQSILNDTIVPRDVFISQLTEFIIAQRNHLEHEDKIIYPLVDSLLTEQDWQAISATLPPQGDDPLFGKRETTKYKELYRRLIEAEAT